MADSIHRRVCESLRVQGFQFTGRELGAGGGAVVEEAVKNGLPCAVKVSKKSIEESPDTRHEAERGPEIWPVTRKHPGLVTLLDHFSVPVQDTDTELHYLATVWELADASLHERVKRIERDELIGHLRSIASAIDYLNRQSIFHRDVKPSNILMFPGGDARLADLGNAKTVVDPGSQPETIAGTYGFSPPELVIRGICHGTCDMYSLANTYVFMITGQWPFGGDSRGSPLPPREVVQVQQDRERIKRSLSEFGFAGRELELLRVAIEPDPDKRPRGSATAWVDQLHDAVLPTVPANIPETLPADSSAPAELVSGTTITDRARNLGLTDAILRQLVAGSIGARVDELPVRLSQSLDVVGASWAIVLAHEIRQAVQRSRDAVSRMRAKLKSPQRGDSDGIVMSFEYPEVLTERNLLESRLDEDCHEWRSYCALAVPIYRGLGEFCDDVLTISQGYVPKRMRERGTTQFQTKPMLTQFVNKIDYYRRAIERVWLNFPDWQTDCDRFYQDHFMLLGD